MAAKDGDKIRICAEVADLWFHCLVLLARHGLRPADVLAELARREGISGLAEKASRRLTRPATRASRSAGANRTRRERAIRTASSARSSRGEIPSRKVYEDDDDPRVPRHPAGGAGAFHADAEEAHRVAVRASRRSDAPVLGRIMALAGRLAREQGSPDGFRTIVNTGRVGRQEVHACPRPRHRRTRTARADDRRART